MEWKREEMTRQIGKENGAVKKEEKRKRIWERGKEDSGKGREM